MEHLAINVQIFLLLILCVIVLGNSNHVALPENSLDRTASDKSLSKQLQHQKSKNASNSVTYISTYILPTLIWSSHHSKKLREKIRKNKSFNRVKPSKTSSEKKILMNSEDFKKTHINFAEFGDWKDAHKEMERMETNEIQLPIEKMFVDTNLAEGHNHTLSKYDNTTTVGTNMNTNLEKIYGDISKVSQKKRKRKNRKSFIKAISPSLENLNVSTSSNDSFALSTTENSSSDVGQSRTVTGLFLLHTILLPAIILEILTIGAFIFVSPVVGFGLLFITIAGAVLSGFAFLLLL